MWAGAKRQRLDVGGAYASPLPMAACEASETSEAGSAGFGAPARAWANALDPLTRAPLGRHAYVCDGIGRDPALLVRYVLMTGATHLPDDDTVAIDLEQLAAVYAAQVGMEPTVAAISGAETADVLPALRAAQASSSSTSGTMASAAQAQDFFDDQVRMQLEVALTMCELDVVAAPEATAVEFAAGPWRVLPLAFAAYLTLAPLQAAEAATQSRARVVECLAAAQRWAHGEGGDEDAFGVAVLHNPVALQSVHDAVVRLYDAVSSAVLSPATADTDTLYAAVLAGGIHAILAGQGAGNSTRSASSHARANPASSSTSFETAALALLALHAGVVGGDDAEDAEGAEDGEEDDEYDEDGEDDEDDQGDGIDSADDVDDEEEEYDDDEHGGGEHGGNEHGGNGEETEEAAAVRAVIALGDDIAAGRLSLSSEALAVASAAVGAVAGAGGAGGGPTGGDHARILDDPAWTAFHRAWLGSLNAGDTLIAPWDARTVVHAGHVANPFAPMPASVPVPVPAPAPNPVSVSSPRMAEASGWDTVARGGAGSEWDTAMEGALLPTGLLDDSPEPMPEGLMSPLPLPSSSSLSLFFGGAHHNPNLDLSDDEL